MTKIMMMAAASAALLTSVGCATQQRSPAAPETAEYGTARTDARQGEPEEAPKGREFWTKMR